jgi:hypothetical protein
VFFSPAPCDADDDSFIAKLHTIKAHASTVPQNGDLNPYGVTVVSKIVGKLLENHVLVSNFNNAKNLQRTGSTIVQVSPGDGSTQLFAQINASTLPGPFPGGVGLTTALVVLRSGWVNRQQLANNGWNRGNSTGRMPDRAKQHRARRLRQFQKVISTGRGT